MPDSRPHSTSWTGWKTRAATMAFLLLSAAATHGQMVYVQFKDEKVAKKYSKYLTDWQGRRVLVGEAKAGLKLQPQNIQYTGGHEAKNELWVGNPADPSKAPYRTKKGEKVKASGGKTVSFPGEDVKWVGYIDRHLSLEGLALEFKRRQEAIETLEDERDACDKKSKDWLHAHARVVAEIDKTASWLRGMGYGRAAIKLDKEADKQRRTIAKEASEERLRAALDSLEPAEVPEELVEAAQQITGGATVFHGRRTQHLRMYYVEDLPDDVAEAALHLGERILEGFRREFIEPYLDDEFSDPLPDGLIAEFCFVPEDKEAYEKFWSEYYHIGWNEATKERSLEAAGTYTFRNAEYGYLCYFKYNDKRDVEGIVAHHLGHVLADHTYNENRGGDAPAWLSEALSYYLSFGYLGRNSVICFAHDPEAYAERKPEEGEKTVELGMRDYFNGLALQKGPTLDALALKTLAQISDPDFAKAWSLFDWVARTQGKAGQNWLRAMCKAHNNRSTFIQKFREASEEAFGVESGTDVFKVIEEQWREYATQEQLRDHHTR